MPEVEHPIERSATPPSHGFDADIEDAAEPAQPGPGGRVQVTPLHE